FNGDGKADLFLQGTGTNTLAWGPRATGAIGEFMALSLGTSFSTSTWSWSQPTTDWSQYNILFADTNGDGRADMFLQGQGSWLRKLSLGGFGPAGPPGLYLRLSTGSAFSEWTWSQPAADWSEYEAAFADFDGDAAADLFFSGRGSKCPTTCATGQYM